MMLNEILPESKSARFCQLSHPGWLPERVGLVQGQVGRQCHPGAPAWPPWPPWLCFQSGFEDGKKQRQIQGEKSKTEPLEFPIKMMLFVGYALATNAKCECCEQK